MPLVENSISSTDQTIFPFLLMVRAFALEAGGLGSILSRVKPKTLKLVSAVTLAERSARAENKIRQ